MLTKDEMNNLMNEMANYLKNLGIDNEAINGTIVLAKDYAIRSGIYNEEFSDSQKENE